MKRNKFFTAVISIMLVCIMIADLTGCSAVQASDLMEGIEANPVSGKETDDAFREAQMNFSLELFKATAEELKNDNSSGNTNLLISPLSVCLALAMTANGADGDTKKEMETLLGGTFSIEELNEYLYYYVQNLPSDQKYKLEIADSIWFRDGFTPEKDFLQTNADYYGAQAYQSDFDEQTASDINNWVSEHTDEMIDKIVDEIDPATIMYLINALVFDAEWDVPYDDVREGTFFSLSGEERTVDMMYSEEGLYIDDGKATGFIKNYSQGTYAFVALLPNEGVDIYEYIAGLTSADLLDIRNSAISDTVDTAMPKFSYEYSLSMNNILSDLGMPTAFSSSSADFSKLGKSEQGNIYIGEVLHKTFIDVDEKGTKAAAVTSVELKNESISLPQYSVYLDRPFVYMIIDTQTGLPVFMGAVTDFSE